MMRYPRPIWTLRRSCRPFGLNTIWTHRKNAAKWPQAESMQENEYTTFQQKATTLTAKPNRKIPAISRAHREAEQRSYNETTMLNRQTPVVQGIDLVLRQGLYRVRQQLRPLRLSPKSNDMPVIHKNRRFLRETAVMHFIIHMNQKSRKKVTEPTMPCACTPFA